MLAGRLEEALAAYDKAESLDPGAGWIDHGRWEVYILRRDWDQAASAARRLADRDDPYWKWLGFMHLATTEVYRGRSESALAFLGHAAEAYPETEPGGAGAWSASASLRLEKGDAAGAFRDAEQAVREGGPSLNRYIGVLWSALALAELDRWEEADRAAEEIRGLIETIPSERWKRTYNHLIGVFSFFRGNAPEAIERLNTAAALLPARAAPHPLDFNENATLWFDLASAYMANGDTEQAEKWFQRLADSTTEHINWPVPYVRSLFFLGRIHEQRGEMDQAREYYQRFMDLWGDGDLDREWIGEARSKLSS